VKFNYLSTTIRGEGGLSVTSLSIRNES